MCDIDIIKAGALFYTIGQKSAIDHLQQYLLVYSITFVSKNIYIHYIIIIR